MGLLKTWLESKGYQVTITSSKDEMFSLIQQSRPGLVIADIMQSQAVEELKEDCTTVDIPVLLMSGYAMGHENIHLDVEDTIEKPFNLPLFAKKVDDLFQLRA